LTRFRHAFFAPVFENAYGHHQQGCFWQQGRYIMKKWLIAGLGTAGILLSSAALAHVDVGISIGVPGFIAPPPVYVAPPPPVYVAPQPVYVAPPTVYLSPRPAYVRPRVVYPAPVYYGPRYYGGGRGHYHDHHGHHGHWRR